MDCPNCQKPMKLLRERYTGLYETPDGEKEADFSEHTCPECQVGIHTVLGEPVKSAP